MIEWGFSSPLFMARAVITNAPALLLRKAVDDLMQAAWEKDTPCIQVEEMFDRLVQVAATGRYQESEIHANVVHGEDNELSPEDEATVNGFLETLEKIPEVDPDDPTGWLKGIFGEQDETPEDGKDDDDD